MKKDKWYKKTGTDIETIKKLEKLLNITFQEEYIHFLLWSNGGEGIIRNNYIYIWSVEDIIAYNNDYQIDKYLGKDYLAFGMDGDTGYIFHLIDYSIYKADFGDLDIESIIYLAPSFAEFIGNSMIKL